MAPVGKTVMRIHYAIARIYVTTSHCGTFSAGSRCSDFEQGVPAPDVGPAELPGYHCHAIGLSITVESIDTFHGSVSAGYLLAEPKAFSADPLKFL